MATCCAESTYNGYSKISGPSTATEGASHDICLDQDILSASIVDDSDALVARYLRFKFICWCCSTNARTTNKHSTSRDADLTIARGRHKLMKDSLLFQSQSRSATPDNFDAW